MKKSILIMSCAISLFVISCKKDESAPGGTSGGKVTIQNASNNAKNDIVDMVNSEGVKSIESLSAFMEEDNVLNLRTAADKKKFEQVIKRKVAKLKTLFIPSDKFNNGRSANDTGRFVFADHIGVYTWNSTTNSWDINHTGSIIALHFPDDTNSTVNNCVLTITSYNDMAIVNDMGETEYYPTSLHAELKIDNVTQVKLDYTGAFNSDGIPTNISLELFVNPFTYTIAYSINNTTVNASASITKAGATLFAVSGTMVFEDTSLEVVQSISGFVQYDALKVNANIDVEGFNNAVGQDEAMAAHFNQYFLISLHQVGGSLIGNVIFKDVPDPNWPGETYVEAYIKYPDGTEELLSDYLQPIIDELESVDFGV
jgi:hypothetical protein